MTKEKRNLIIVFSTIYILITGTCIGFLIAGLYGHILFFGFPLFFIYPIFLTFYKVPKRINYHVAKFIFQIILRYLMIGVAIAIPALIRFFVPWIQETVNALFLLVPFFEVILVYIIIMILFIIKSKQEVNNTKDKQNNNEHR